MKKMFAALLPPEWFLPIDGIGATNNECMCDVHHIGCSIALLLARTLRWFSGLLHLLEMAQNDLVACFVLHDRRAHLRFENVNKHFFVNKKKLIDKYK